MGDINATLSLDSNPFSASVQNVSRQIDHLESNLLRIPRSALHAFSVYGVLEFTKHVIEGADALRGLSEESKHNLHALDESFKLTSDIVKSFTAKLMETTLVPLLPKGFIEAVKEEDRRQEEKKHREKAYDVVARTQKVMEETSMIGESDIEKINRIKEKQGEILQSIIAEKNGRNDILKISQLDYERRLAMKEIAEITNRKEVNAARESAREREKNTKLTMDLEEFSFDRSLKKMSLDQQYTSLMQRADIVESHGGEDDPLKAAHLRAKAEDLDPKLKRFRDANFLQSVGASGGGGNSNALISHVHATANHTKEIHSEMKKANISLEKITNNAFNDSGGMAQ